MKQARSHIGGFGRRPRPGYALNGTQATPRLTLSTTAGGHLGDRVDCVESLKLPALIPVIRQGSSVRRSGQTGEDDVVDVGSGKAVGAGVVLKGGNHPVLGFDRRESGQARALHELEHRVVR
jgi:hypothetical protein